MHNSLDWKLYKSHCKRWFFCKYLYFAFKSCIAYLASFNILCSGDALAPAVCYNYYKFLSDILLPV